MVDDDSTERIKGSIYYHLPNNLTVQIFEDGVFEIKGNDKIGTKLDCWEIILNSERFNIFKMPKIPKFWGGRKSNKKRDGSKKNKKKKKSTQRK